MGVFALALSPSLKVQQKYLICDIDFQGEWQTKPIKRQRHNLGKLLSHLFRSLRNREPIEKQQKHLHLCPWRTSKDASNRNTKSPNLQ